MKEIKSHYHQKIYAVMAAVIVLLCCFAAATEAAQVSEEWVKRKFNTQPLSIGIDGSDNIYVAGTAIYSLDRSLAIAKYDRSGNELWARMYRNDQFAYFHNAFNGMMVDREGNMYFVGFSIDSIGNYCALLKFDSNGNLLWRQRFDNSLVSPSLPPHARPDAMALDREGNVYLAGHVTGSVSNDFVTVKYDTNGNLLWSRLYNKAGSDIPAAMAVDNAGRVLVTGTAGSGDIATVAYDRDGTKLWDVVYDGPAHLRDRPSAISVDGNGNVYVVGSSEVSASQYKNSMVFLKYSPEGLLLLTDITQKQTTLMGSKVKIVNDGVLAIGSVNAKSSCGYCHWIGSPTPSEAVAIKYGPDGQKLWENVSSDPQDSGFGALNIDSAGNIFVSGRGHNGPIDSGGYPDFLNIKYDQNGAFLWAVNSTSLISNNNYVIDSAIDSHGALYVIGSEGSQNMITMKYSEPNHGPVANAGADRVEECPSTPEVNVQLSGSGSYDPNDDLSLLDFRWTWVNPDGSTQTAEGVTLDITLPEWGTYTIELTVTDPHGLSSTDTVTVTVGDTIAPVTVASVVGVKDPATGIYLSEVNVTLTSTDSCTGIREIHYEINGVPYVIDIDPALPEATTGFSLIESGAYEIRFWAVDNAGRISSSGATTVNADVTIPGPGTGGGGSYTSCVSVELQMVDDSGQMLLVYYDNGSWVPYEGAFEICQEGGTGISYGYMAPSANVEEAQTLNLTIDLSAPFLYLPANITKEATGPEGAVVTFTVTATDTTDPNPVVICSPSSGSVFPIGTMLVVCTATDRAGRSTSGSFTVTVQDTTPPVITVTGITDGGRYVRCSVPDPGYTVSDSATGVDPSSIDAVLDPADLNSVGDHTYTVTAKDYAGNQTTVSVTFTVIYSGGGVDWQQPVSLYKPFKQGSTIPVKFSLTDGCGMPVVNAQAVLTLQFVNGSTSGEPPIDATSNVPDSGNVFRFVDGHYIYNLATDGLSVGTWNAFVTLDGVQTDSIPIIIKQ